MKALALLLLTQFAHAQMAQDKINSLVAEVKPFQAQCLADPVTSEVNGLNFENKTAESLDKKVVVDQLMKDFGLTLKSKSKKTIDITLAASSKEKKKVRTTTFTFKAVLKDGENELCKKFYSKVFTETL